MISSIVNSIEKNVKELMEEIEKIESKEIQLLLMIAFLYKCGTNDKQIIKWLEDFKADTLEDKKE